MHLRERGCQGHPLNPTKTTKNIFKLKVVQKLHNWIANQVHVEEKSVSEYILNIFFMFSQESRKKCLITVRWMRPSNLRDSRLCWKLFQCSKRFRRPAEIPRPFIELPSIERNINKNSIPFGTRYIYSSTQQPVQCTEASSKSFTPHHLPLRLNSPPGKWVRPADRRSTIFNLL